MILERIEMFKGLSNVELAKLLGKLEKENLPRGQTLFRQGEPGDAMYLIEKGKLELLSVSADGGEQTLALLEEGTSLGEMAVITSEPRSATAVAATDVSLFVMDRDTIERLMDEQPSVSRYFIRLMSRRLVSTNERLQLSEETRYQGMARELDRFPERLVSFLLWGADFPVVSRKLAETRFSFVLEEQLERFPDLRRFLRFEGGGRDRFSVVSEYRQLLSDMARDKYGYAEKSVWLEEAIAFSEREGDWPVAARLHAHAGNWDGLLDLIGQAGSRLTGEQKKEIFALLRRCPSERVAVRFPILREYAAYCLEESPETGIALVEYALDHHTESYSAEELVSVYEWGAELNRRMNREAHALEYLKLAEMTALSVRGEGSKRGKPENPGYGLAKQKLMRSKSVLQAEGAGRLVGKGTLTGIAATAAAAASVALFAWLEPFAGLSGQAMLFIGVAVAAVILWIVNIIPDYIVALGMLMFWVLGGLVDTETAFSGFASPTWFYMIFIMALSAAITKSGILFRFALHALKRFPPNYRGQIWGIVAGGAVLNPLIPSSSAKVTLGVPIARTLSESMGFAPGSKGAAGLGLTAMIFYGFTAPFVLTGSYTNMMAYGLAAGEEPIGWLRWFLNAFPAFVVFGGAMLLLLSLMFKRTTAPKPISAEVLDEQLRLIGPLTRQEIVAMGTVVGCIALMILQPLHGIESTWIMMTGFSILVVAGVLDRQTVSTGIDWTFLLFLGVAFSFSRAVEDLGIGAALSSFLGDNLAFFMASPYLFLAAVVVLSFAVTLVVRDDPAVILLVTALLPLGEAAGVHPWILVFIILLCTDPFFFSYQSPTYLTAYYSSEGKAFDHRQGQRVGLAYAMAVVAAVAVSVPYWMWIGLIS